MPDAVRSGGALRFALLCLVALLLTACAGQQLEIRPRGEAVMGIGVGHR